MNRFQWWRRLRGGRWGRVTGFMWGYRWVRVTDACVERVDEDWRSSAEMGLEPEMSGK